jgi:hypothetical protein
MVTRYYPPPKLPLRALDERIDTIIESERRQSGKFRGWKSEGNEGTNEETLD